MWKAARRRYGNLDDPTPVERHAGLSESASLLDFRGLGLIVRRRFRLIGTILALVLLATAAALVIIPPRYSATAVVLVDPRQPRVTSTESVLSGIGSDALVPFARRSNAKAPPAKVKDRHWEVMVAYYTSASPFFSNCKSCT